MPAIRAITAQDVPQLHALIRACYAAYGMTFSLDDPAEVHLIDPIAYFNGRLWGIDGEGGSLIASAGLSVEAGVGLAEIKTVYVRPHARRRGLATALTEHAIGAARALGVPRLHLWSDARFTGAHALYERMGFTRTDEVRACDDFNDSSEYHFTRATNP